NYEVRAPPPAGSPRGSQPGSAQVRFEHCGDDASADLAVSIPVSNLGAVEGYVHDQENGAPVDGAIVNAPSDTLGLCQATTSDATGYYRLDRVLVGFDATTSDVKSVVVSKSGYFGNAVGVPFV